MAKKITTSPRADATSDYELPCDDDDLGAVLAPVEEALKTYSSSSPAGQLRAAIAADTAHRGQWFQLRSYKPLRRRVALNVATSWPRAKPVSPEGDRSFEALAMALDNEGRLRRVLTITTQWTDAVRYSTAERGSK
jgi:hypothetical protein